jgi:hypothetical protein
MNINISQVCADKVFDKVSKQILAGIDKSFIKANFQTYFTAKITWFKLSNNLKPIFPIYAKAWSKIHKYCPTGKSLPIKTVNKQKRSETKCFSCT